MRVRLTDKASRGVYGAASRSGRLPGPHSQGALLYPVLCGLPGASIQYRKANKGALSPGAGETFGLFTGTGLRPRDPRSPTEGRRGDGFLSPAPSRQLPCGRPKGQHLLHH